MWWRAMFYKASLVASLGSKTQNMKSTDCWQDWPQINVKCCNPIQPEQCCGDRTTDDDCATCVFTIGPKAFVILCHRTRALLGICALGSEPRTSLSSRLCKDGNSSMLTSGASR